MAAFVKAGQTACTACRADRGGGEGVGEADPAFGESVEVWCVDDGVTGTAEEIGALVVGEDEEDVGRRRHRQSPGFGN